MLYLLYYFGYQAPDETLGEGNPLFRIFGYLTVRAALALAVALLAGILTGPIFIRLLRRKKIGQQIRGNGIPDLYERHKNKAETPTMGGILILAAFFFALLVCGNPTSPLVWLTLFAAFGFGAVGAMDDWAKLSKRNHKGISARAKLLGQGIVASIIACWIYNFPPETLFRASLDASVVEAPHSITTIFFKWLIPLGLAYIPWVILVLVTTSNAVNLTDGLDGLAIGCVLFVASAYALVAYLAGRYDFANGYLWIVYVRGAGELAVCCAALAGASLAFLWYNCHPAEVFMGDTGSLALGGTIATIAVLIHQEFMLMVVGGIFVAEALSVVIQVSSFKMTGKRIFRMTPLHHHFEQLGWHESKIITRFWIIAALLAMMGLLTLKTR
ncbi:MAG: phospho-N-acetylmuramoyl-pentapeptide-transferase [Candidatus Omnitrophica bacterium]|nr:Phospho-N-acetylmuramoyl-pentapeptide-transferase [bacterium]NUN98835.1 phospho-N-acetylmuramoyl-pentapeptide-transferase [Candidatus Omnitrophota bacterium]